MTPIKTGMEVVMQERINTLATQLYDVAGYERSAMFRCFLNGEHYGYFSGQPSDVTAFTPDWFRFSRPCWR